MMGISTCSTKPVDMRGVKFVPDTGFRLGENDGRTLPWQLKLTSKVAQPKVVVFKLISWLVLRRQCDCRAMKSTPVSIKHAIATGPTMGTRHSKLATNLVSAPGKVMSCMGTVIAT